MARPTLKERLEQRSRDYVEMLGSRDAIARDHSVLLDKLRRAEDRVETLLAGRALTVVESPFLGGLSWAVAYARAALADSLRRGESPFASHLLYPQVLDDMDPESRRRGLEAGLALYPQAVRCAVYVDFGITPGMAEGILRAAGATTPIVYRSFGPVVRQAIANGTGFPADMKAASEGGFPARLIPVVR